MCYIASCIHLGKCRIDTVAKELVTYIKQAQNLPTECKDQTTGCDCTGSHSRVQAAGSCLSKKLKAQSETGSSYGWNLTRGGSLSRILTGRKAWQWPR